MFEHTFRYIMKIRSSVRIEPTPSSLSDQRVVDFVYQGKYRYQSVNFSTFMEVWRCSVYPEGDVNFL